MGRRRIVMHGMITVARRWLRGNVKLALAAPLVLGVVLTMTMANVPTAKADPAEDAFRLARDITTRLMTTQPNGRAAVDYELNVLWRKDGNGETHYSPYQFTVYWRGPSDIDHVDF